MLTRIAPIRGGGELGDDPLGAVRRPDADPVAASPTPSASSPRANRSHGLRRTARVGAAHPLVHADQRLVVGERARPRSRSRRSSRRSAARRSRRGRTRAHACAGSSCLRPGPSLPVPWPPPDRPTTPMLARRALVRKTWPGIPAAGRRGQPGRWRCLPGGAGKPSRPIRGLRLPEPPGSGHHVRHDRTAAPRARGMDAGLLAPA